MAMGADPFHEARLIERKEIWEIRKPFEGRDQAAGLI
jgi:hypothetical protein